MAPHVIAAECLAQQAPRLLTPQSRGQVAASRNLPLTSHVRGVTTGPFGGAHRMSSDKDRYVDLWMKQSQLFWQTVQQVPVLAGAIFAGWFALQSASHHVLALGLLVVGVLSMIVQVLVLLRMTQYLNAFRDAADRQIPTVPSSVLGLTGYRLGISIPCMVAIFFCALFAWAADSLPTKSASSTALPLTPASAPASATTVKAQPAPSASVPAAPPQSGRTP